jgi:oligoendopeptidase F
VSQNNGQYPQTRWTLEALLPSPEGSTIDQAMADLETATSSLEALRPALSPDMSGEEFVQALKALENFAVIAHRLGSYGRLAGW